MKKGGVLLRAVDSAANVTRKDPHDCMQECGRRFLDAVYSVVRAKKVPALWSVAVSVFPDSAMQEFGLNGSTLVAVGRTVALLRSTLTLDNCVRALEIVSRQLRNLTILMPHGGIGELILDGCANARPNLDTFASCSLPYSQVSPRGQFLQRRE